MKIITSTGIKAKDAKKYELTEDNILEKLGCDVAPDFEKKDELEVGRFLQAHEDGSFTVFSVEDRDVTAEYGDLDEKAKRGCWADGFKRTYVNKPNHEDVKSSLGMVEASKTAKAVENVYDTIAKAALVSGLTPAQVFNITEGKIPMYILEAWEESIKSS